MENAEGYPQKQKPEREYLVPHIRPPVFLYIANGLAQAEVEDKYRERKDRLLDDIRKQFPYKNNPRILPDDPYLELSSEDVRFIKDTLEKGTAVSRLNSEMMRELSENFQDARTNAYMNRLGRNVKKRVNARVEAVKKFFQKGK